MHDKAWVDGLSYAQVLSETVRLHGDREAFVFPKSGYRRTFREFQDEVREIALALLAFGVQHGEHVGIWSTNLPQWVVAQFAAAQIGAVLVNINPAYRAHELAYVLNQADVTVLLLTDRFKHSQYFDLLAEVCPEIKEPANERLRASAFPKLRHVVSLKEDKLPGMWNWSEFRGLSGKVNARHLDRRQETVQAGDVVNIQYTSGTTGFPKGAMLTHRNLLMNGYCIGQRLRYTPEDRLCLPVPFYHCFGCVMGTLMCVSHGAAAVVPAEMFDPLATLETIQAERCTGIYGVPTMFIAELNHPRFAEFNLKSLRTGVMAGSPCPIEVMRAVVEKMGAREMTIAYGLTEASPVITQTETTDSVEHRVGTVGKVLPGAEARIIKPGTLEDVAPGESGELIARGHGIMKGYYNKPKETADAFTPDGWLHSGDLAARTPDGYYRITGRIKDMLIRGGENVYPREIEEFFHQNPKIADVQVVGLPDESFGEEISAWIRVKPGEVLTEEEVRASCRGKIAHYKIPKYIVIVDEYPTTVTGKVQKFKLRELGVEKFNLQKAAAMETA